MENFQEIIDLLQKQDKAALEKLYEQYGRKFYSYCVSKWHLTEDEAWDVVYRTLETLILKVLNYSFATQDDFNRFVYKVLINFLRQHYRSKQSKRMKEIEFVDLDGIGLNDSFSKYLSTESLKDYYRSESFDSPELIRLRAVLESFDELDKDLLLLRAQNYSYTEIAAMLNIENNQLKVRHHRAKRKLVEMLTSLQTI